MLLSPSSFSGEGAEGEYLPLTPVRALESPLRELDMCTFKLGVDVKAKSNWLMALKLRQ